MWINAILVTLILQLLKTVSCYIISHNDNFNVPLQKIPLITQSVNYQFCLHAKNDYSGRKRRSKVPKTSSSSAVEEFSKPNIIPKNEVSSINFNEVDISKLKSKLPPISGSIEDIRQKYNEKSGIERWISDLTAPTPVGQEPKLIQLIKAITWGAVIVLVLVEIYVSVKVGGMPFDFSQAKDVSPKVDP